MHTCITHSDLNFTPTINWSMPLHWPINLLIYLSQPLYCHTHWDSWQPSLYLKKHAVQLNVRDLPLEWLVTVHQTLVTTVLINHGHVFSSSLVTYRFAPFIRNQWTMEEKADLEDTSQRMCFSHYQASPAAVLGWLGDACRLYKTMPCGLLSYQCA